VCSGIQPDSKVVQPGQSLTITCRLSRYSLYDGYGTGVYCIDLIQPDSSVVQPGQSLTIACWVSGYALYDSSYATEEDLRRRLPATHCQSVALSGVPEPDLAVSFEDLGLLSSEKKSFNPMNKDSNLRLLLWISPAGSFLYS
ncbi:hypothetical protein CRENBAI_012392, partial [Crenichthys baileyi]